MTSQTVALPCRRHPHDCVRHRYHSPHLSSTPSPLSKNRPTSIHPTSTWTTLKSKWLKPSSRGSKTPKQVSKIQQLPTEILLLIYELLSPLSRVSLALSCRQFALMMGPQAWKHMGWYSWLDVMDLRQKDFDEALFWRCDNCLLFHARGRCHPKPAPILFLSNSLSRRSRARLYYGRSSDPQYVLDFELVKGVMDRHFLGSGHGMCLNAMKCRGSMIIPINMVYEFKLDYTYSPKIVVDRLLLRAVYRFNPQKLMFTNNHPSGRLDTLEILRDLDFWICGHLKVGIAADIRNKKIKRLSRTCSFCPTHCVVYLYIQHGVEKYVEFSVWQNVGAGRDMRDRKWDHLTRTGRRKKPYKTDGKNLERAFERMFCSTREEFDYQFKKTRNSSMVWSRLQRHSCLGDTQATEDAPTESQFQSLLKTVADSL